MRSESTKSQFRFLLLLAFILEGAGYLALPYLALHLRESFGISEVSIGFYFMVGMWLRPIWALSSSALTKWMPPSRLIQLGGLVGGLAISGLAFSRNPIIALFSIIFANFAIAIWNPSTYAYVYDLFGNNEDTKKYVSKLNFSTYTGAAIGSAIAALLANSQRDLIFLASAFAFIIAAVLGSFLTKAHHEIKEENKESTANPEQQGFSKLHMVFLIIASIGYWGSYAQFNSFFSLFATDWLKHPEIVGAAFSFLTIVVAVISLVISHFNFLQKNDTKIAVGILFIIGATWFAMLTMPSVWMTWTFIAVLALSEAFFVMVIAHLWAKQSTKNAHFMQTLNFSLCNVGMGAGAALGGYLYKEPSSGGTLVNFGLENMAFCWLSCLALIVILFTMRKKTESKINFKPFYFSNHNQSGLTVYLFEKDALKANKKLASELVSYCEKIQDQVWTKKFETAHNTIEQDTLLLFWDKSKNQPAGFFSASYIEENGKIFLYHSDGMVLPQYWGKGLLSYFFKTMNELGVKKYNAKPIINIVATGYLFMLSCFEGKKHYKRLNWPPDLETMSIITKILKQSFMDLPIDKNGIIRSAWRPQKNEMKNVWPSELALKYAFPSDVNYFNGDVLVRLYSYKP